MRLDVFGFVKARRGYDVTCFDIEISLCLFFRAAGGFLRKMPRLGYQKHVVDIFVTFSSLFHNNFVLGEIIENVEFQKHPFMNILRCYIYK